MVVNGLKITICTVSTELGTTLNQQVQGSSPWCDVRPAGL